MTEKETMQPVGGQMDGEMGRYEMMQRPAQDLQRHFEPEFAQVVRGNRATESRQRNVTDRFQSVRRYAKLAGAALAIYGGVQIYQALTGNEGAHMTGEVTSEETRVTVYENPPIELANIESDISLELDAGYDRTVSAFGIDIDINPINNEYYFSQKDLTANTKATLTPAVMRVEESEDHFEVTFEGQMELSQSAFDWTEEELAGADIKGTSFSFGNELKDEIDNDALEIMQESAGVTAACALRDEQIADALTGGIANFLRVVNPDFKDSNKPLKVSVSGLDEQSARLYAQAVDRLNQTVEAIKADYSGPHDQFELDISSILNCDAQDIRLMGNG